MTLRPLGAGGASLCTGSPYDALPPEMPSYPQPPLPTCRPHRGIGSECLWIGPGSPALGTNNALR